MYIDLEGMPSKVVQNRERFQNISEGNRHLPFHTQNAENKMRTGTADTKG